jgi:hypothetical protein
MQLKTFFEYCNCRLGFLKRIEYVRHNITFLVILGLCNDLSHSLSERVINDESGRI